MKSQRKEGSVNQHVTERDFIKHKCVTAAYTVQKPALQSISLALTCNKKASSSVSSMLVTKTKQAEVKVNKEHR